MYILQVLSLVSPSSMGLTQFNQTKNHGPLMFYRPAGFRAFTRRNVPFAATESQINYHAVTPSEE